LSNTGQGQALPLQSNTGQGLVLGPYTYYGFVSGS
jgi:hypothetical protein